MTVTAGLEVEARQTNRPTRKGVRSSDRGRITPRVEFGVSAEMPRSSGRNGESPHSNEGSGCRGYFLLTNLPDDRTVTVGVGPESQ